MIEIIPNFHPIFVHFTVALLSLSVALFVISPFSPEKLKPQWQTVAQWSLWFGAIMTVITAITGLHAYNTVAHDTPSHLAMTDHRNWAVVTLLLFLTLAGWLAVCVRNSKQPGVLFIVAMLMAGGVLASTAWRGGELVYRHGLGVMSLPETSGEGHGHDAGGDDHGHDNEGQTMPMVNPANNTDSHMMPEQTDSHEHGDHAH